jgi:lysophospholipase L1-like esterase
VKTIRGNFLASLLGLTFSFLVGEAILQGHYRVRNGQWLFRQKSNFIIHYIAPAPDRREYTLKPGYVEEGLYINENGFRGSLISPNDPAPLICVLGDSVPFGVDVPDDQTYPFLLQAELCKSGQRVNVLNAGVPSYNLRQSIDRFRYEVVPPYRPGLVIIQAANDVMLATHYREEWTPDVTWATVRMKGGVDYSCAIGRCALYRYVTRAARIHAAREKEFHKEFAPDRMIEGIQDTLARELSRFTRRGISVILLPNDPFYYSGPDRTRNRQLKRWWEYAFYHRIWNRSVDRYNQALADAASRASGVYFFDTRTIMDTQDRGKMYVDFIHLSPAGNAVLAKTLAEFIRRGKLIPPPRPTANG